jgi:hypothetical protein
MICPSLSSASPQAVWRRQSLSRLLQLQQADTHCTWFVEYIIDLSFGCFK